MHSSLICAFSGAFLLAGGWCCVIWVFLRALALHLQICWQMNIGKTFMWAAMAAGWGIPSIALTLSMVFTGVSFRFGDTCHLNHKNSLADFWIPLLVFAGATVVIQFGTFAYCIKVYLASLGDDSTTTNSSGALPSYTNSIRTTITPKQAYRRIRRVIELQWRGIAVVLLIIADVIFFAIVFVFMDDVETNLLRHPSKAQDWITCLITAKGDKHKCMASADALVVNEQTITAVLLLLSVSAILQCNNDCTPLTLTPAQRLLGLDLPRPLLHDQRLVRADPKAHPTKARIRQRRRASHGSALIRDAR